MSKSLSFEEDPDVDPYILGISNYCDRWCERCALSHRCALFADEQRMERLFDDPTAEDLMNQIERSLDGPTLAFPELGSPTAPSEPYTLHIPEFDETTTNSASGSDGEGSGGGNFIDPCAHPLILAGDHYGIEVGRWLEGAGADLEEVARRLETLLDATDSDAPARDIVAFEEALEVIGWYRFQIGIKLRRALQSRSEEEAEGEHSVPHDADGSTKVALIGIDRSLMAWNRLAIDLPVQRPRLEQITTHLETLRRDAEAHFPKARGFARPGFEAREIGS